MNYLAVLSLPSPAFTYQPKEREREAEHPVTSKVTYQPKPLAEGYPVRGGHWVAVSSKVGRWSCLLSSCLLSLPVRRASRLAISEPVALIVELPCCLVPPVPDYYLSARKQRITMEAEKQDIQYYEKYISRQGLSMVERPFCPPASYLLLLPGLCVTTRKRKQSRSRIFSFIQRLIGVDC